MSNSILFYYTLIILLVSIMASAVCVSTFLVSQKKTTAYAAIGFLVYFFDVALVFQHAYVTNNLLIHPTDIFAIPSPFISIITGAGVLGAFWLMTCEYINEQRRVVRITPIGIFILGSLLAYFVVPSGGLHQFIFYSMREIMLCIGLIYLGIHFIAEKKELERHRLFRHWKIYLWAWVGCIAIVVENIVFQLVLNNAFTKGIIPFLPDRNFAENILMLGVALAVFHSCTQVLKLHYEKPPTNGEQPVQDYIVSNLNSYCSHYDLSAREGEVLTLLLQGFDNQHIASDLNLALSTVKVHVHNILKKTHLSNRQDVIHDFWKTV